MNKTFLMMMAICIGGMSLPSHAVKKMIRMPHLFGVDLAGQAQPNEWLELDGQEAYSTEKFVDLIEAKQKEGLFFIMARVMTRAVGGYNVHYFDADFLHRAYGVHYPFHGTYRLMSAADSLNRSPILNIEYFIISGPNAPAFEYLCCGAETLGEIDPHTLYRDIFYLNQSEDRGLRFAAALELVPHLALIERHMPGMAALIKYYLGEIYYRGESGIAKNNVKARPYFEQAANQNSNLWAAAGGQYGLGSMYYNGNGVAENDALARQYFEQVANQNINLGAAARAKFNLGNMYYYAFGVVKNDVMARQYFEQAANQNIDLWAAAGAKFYLGLIYYKGEAGVAKNDVTAHQYFEQVANQNDNDDAREDAKYYLGLMYYNGDGVPKNVVTARQYFEQVANQKINDEAAALARAKIDELNQEAARAEASGTRPAKKQRLNKKEDQ
jgi:TPR repeat protein